MGAPLFSLIPFPPVMTPLPPTVYSVSINADKCTYKKCVDNSELNIVFKTFCLNIVSFFLLPNFTSFSLLWISVSHSSERWLRCENGDLCNSHRSTRPPRRQTESELTNLTPLSSFSLRNRYLSRLGAQVRGAPTRRGGGGICCQTRSLLHRGRCLLLPPSLPQLPDHCSTHLSSLSYRSVLKWCLKSQKRHAVVTKCLFDDTFGSHLNLTCTEIIFYLDYILWCTLNVGFHGWKRFFLLWIHLNWFLCCALKLLLFTSMEVLMTGGVVPMFRKDPGPVLPATFTGRPLALWYSWLSDWWPRV